MVPNQIFVTRPKAQKSQAQSQSKFVHSNSGLFSFFVRWFGFLGFFLLSTNTHKYTFAAST